MKQTQELLRVLKKSIRSSGMTYADVAGSLDISEASIKRIFSTGNISLNRLDEICEVVGLEIVDLLQGLIGEHHKLDELTTEQELALTADPQLILLAFLSINGFQFEDILTNYAFTEAGLIKKLIALDKIKVIELMPNNRIKLLVSTKFRWKQNGPIEHFFRSKLQSDFLNNSFTEKYHQHYFLTGVLSEDAMEALNERLVCAFNDFQILNQQESHIEVRQRQVCSLLIAFRPWKPAVFDKLRR